MLNFVSTFLRKVNPFQQIKNLKATKPGFKYWTSDESSRFIERCKGIDPEFTDLVLFAIRTGLRVGECRALVRSDLDFENRLIRVGATWAWKLKKKLDRSKNGEIDFVPMSQQVHDLLVTKKLMRMDQPVFRPQLFAEVNIRLKRLCKKSGSPELNFHALRHTYASQLAMAGVDLFKIQRLMRHKSIEMTQRYAHLHPDSIKGITDVLDDSRMTRRGLKFESSKSVSS